MTIRVDQILQQLSERLLSVSADNAVLDAEILLCHALEKPRIWLKTWPDKTLEASIIAKLEPLVTRRLAGEPIAYIVGSKEFWSMELQVNQHTLVPRPETELLVEIALELIKDSDKSIVDLGTGSGAIALALASEFPQKSIYSTDFSHDALEIAQLNAQAHNLKNITFHQGSWLASWPHGKVDCIVSNPPYIDKDDQHLESLTFEPYSALVADNKGLSDIETITQQAIKTLNCDGYLLFEHGFQQGQDVRKILSDAGFINVQTRADLSENDRVSFGRWSGK